MAAFAFAVFLSAFLLFQVQAVVARWLMPWYGGASSVWTTCLLFFQTMMVLGYGYAHLAGRLPPRRAIVLHGGLLLLAILALPVIPPDWLRPSGGEAPVPLILLTLAVTCGLPYLALAGASPLLQSWFTRACPGRAPWPLFALGNAGSLLGLLSYPFLFEPLLTRASQSWVWSGGFILAALGTVAACWLAVKATTTPAHEAPPPVESDAPPSPPPRPEGPGSRASRRLREARSGVATDPEQPPEPHVPLRWLWWIMLPALGCAVMMGHSNLMTQDIASVPLLWVLPLSLYLVTFILPFAGARWYPRIIMPLLVAFGGVMGYHVLEADGSIGILQHVALLSGSLFLICYACHGEVYRLRPAASQLTIFYFCVSLGGAIGGTFVAVIAPLIFTGWYEVHLSLLLASVLLLWRWVDGSRGALLALFAGAAGVAMYLLAQSISASNGLDELLGKVWAFRVQLILAAGLGLIVAGRPKVSGEDRLRNINRWLIIGLGGPFIAILAMHLWQTTNHDPKGWRGRLVERTRTFHGILMVTEKDESANGRRRDLFHGSIIHGIQFLDNNLHRRPTSYYSANSGIGVMLEEFQTDGEPMRVGLIGLGTGATTVFARPGENWRIYEIDREIERLAREHFRWLADCEAESLEVIIGDGRLSLEREQPNNFHLLAVDAFTGDAIPIHLLTREAVELYFRHLTDDGVLALHIQNRHIDLLPVVGRIAADMGLWMAERENPDDDSAGVYSARWVLLSRSGQQVGRALVRAGMDWVRDPVSVKSEFGHEIAWTDDYSSLIPILKIVREGFE